MEKEKQGTTWMRQRFMNDLGMRSTNENEPNRISNKIGLTRPYLVKLINGKAATSSAIKAFIAGDLDVQYIFTGQSDREEIKIKC